MTQLKYAEGCRRHRWPSSLPTRNISCQNTLRHQRLARFSAATSYHFVSPQEEINDSKVGEDKKKQKQNGNMKPVSVNDPPDATPRQSKRIRLLRPPYAAEVTRCSLYTANHSVYFWEAANGRHRQKEINKKQKTNKKNIELRTLMTTVAFTTDKRRLNPLSSTSTRLLMRLFEIGARFPVSQFYTLAWARLPVSYTYTGRRRPWQRI